MTIEWSQRFDREITDVFAIQDEISQAIVEKLRVRLAADRPLVKRRAENVEADQPVLEGALSPFQVYSRTGLRIVGHAEGDTMAERSRDWYRQAEADLRHARHAGEDADFEWAAFAAQQAAEKALKALFQKLHLDAWGHTLSLLVSSLPPSVDVAPGLLDAAKRLDKHYIPTRYPNGFDRGAPVDFYTLGEAQQAIADAEAIVGFCGRQIG